MISAVIKKGKKLEKADVIRQELQEEAKPPKNQKLEEKSEGPKHEAMEKTIKPKAEKLLETESLLQSAKKKQPPKDANAYDKEAGYFKVKKDKEGMWEESGVSAKERYLQKLKSRKGM
jgi:hypothetical protein